MGPEAIMLPKIGTQYFRMKRSILKEGEKEVD